jgi:hypothetical protein
MATSQKINLCYRSRFSSVLLARTGDDLSMTAITFRLFPPDIAQT